MLFASLVDDPSNDAPEEVAKAERDRLFSLLEELVKPEALGDADIIDRARVEILKSTGSNPPPVLDPFCGGGSIPLEAQRLGLETHGSDLNPVAALISKALVEIPPKFAGRPPVNPESRQTFGHSDGWLRAQGLAEDVRYYGKWMRDEAEKRIGHLYPKGPNGETVIAWLWARTVRCPNPACGTMMPLTSKYWLSKKGTKAWVEPVVDREAKRIHFEVRHGEPDETTSWQADMGSGFVTAKGKRVKATFRCVVCEQGVAKGDYIDSEANEGRMGVMPLAIVAEANRSRAFFSFDSAQEQTAFYESEQYIIQAGIYEKIPMEPARGTFASNAQGRRYGFKTYSDYFTLRQLTALITLSDIVEEAREKVRKDALAAEHLKTSMRPNNSVKDAQAYGDAIATYLGLTVSKATRFTTALSMWRADERKLSRAFGRQAISITWDFAENNPFARAGGGFLDLLRGTAEIIQQTPASRTSSIKQARSSEAYAMAELPMVSTDPPYYDNVSYADLSDYYYVWLRRSLSEVYPKIFDTLLVPKSEELVVAPYRFAGDKKRARDFFEVGLGQAFARMREQTNPNFPMTIYYAFKQAESEQSGDNAAVVASTGWETMLEGLLASGFQITGTWPIETEGKTRMSAMGTNALASSIVLVCRPRPAEAPSATRQEFVRALRRELPEALSVMMSENVAPVDLAQATIGPGMAIYSRYSKVVEADGQPMRVRTALQIINQSLDEHLSETEGDVDSHTRFALTWFEQHGVESGPFGEAESIAIARNVSVRGVVDAGILEARAGKVRLLSRESLAEDWDPATDERLIDWEVVQYLIRALETQGEMGAARLLARIGERGESARDLAYRLYGICERKKWAEEALAYNGLVMSWPEIARLAAENPEGTEAQTSMEF